MLRRGRYPGRVGKSTVMEKRLARLEGKIPVVPHPEQIPKLLRYSVVDIKTAVAYHGKKPDLIKHFNTTSPIHIGQSIVEDGVKYTVGGLVYYTIKYFGEPDKQVAAYLFKEK